MKTYNNINYYPNQVNLNENQNKCRNFYEGNDPIKESSKLISSYLNKMKNFNTIR